MPTWTVYFDPFLGSLAMAPIIAAAGTTPHEVDLSGSSGTGPFPLGFTPTIIEVRHNSFWLRRVTVFSGDANEFILSGSAITTSETISPTDDLYALVFV